MKKKFNLMCVAMLAALVFITVAPLVGVSGYIGDAMSGARKMEQMDPDKRQQLRGHASSVEMLPKGTPVNYTHQIVNEKTGEPSDIQIVQAIVHAPMNANDSRAFNIALPALGVLTTVVIIAILVFFVKIILAVNRNQIFDTHMERRLGWCGTLMIAYYAIAWIITLTNYWHNVAMYDFKDYMVTINNYPNGTVLLAGVGMLLIAQVFKIARRIKEDQELTI